MTRRNDTPHPDSKRTADAKRKTRDMRAARALKASLYAKR